MMYNNWGNWGGGDGQWGMMSAGWGGNEWVLWALVIAAPFIVLAILWSVFWKGLALWHAARRGQYWWFLIILFVNTLGILELIYLFVVAKLKVGDLFSTHSGHPEHSHHH
ncbi:MAG: DUF5652 family protein [Patescibacteria group bacterium]